MAGFTILRIYLVLPMFLCNKSNAQTDASSSLNLTNQNLDSICGTIAIKARPLIAYGQSTDEGEFPWHTALYYSKNSNLSYVCGGSIISKSHVITAAHCVTRPKTNIPVRINKLLLYLGQYFFRDFSNSSVQERKATNIVPHPLYNAQSYANDIALVKLEAPAEITDYVRPICLWQGASEITTVVNKVGTVVGWGFDETGEFTKELMQAQMPVVSNGKCELSFPEFFLRYLSTKSFCAGFQNGTTVCNGDSGSGLAFRNFNSNPSNPTWQLRGLVSIGAALHNQSKCDLLHYTIFTDVAQYMDWIEKTMQGDSCLVPNNPPNGEFKVDSATSNPGDYAPPFGALVINCNNRYKPSPPQRVDYPICTRGQWSIPPPTCARFCPSIKPTVATKVSCKFDNRPLDSCENPIEGTIASLSCEPLYEEPGLLRNPKRICKDGSWDYPISECLPGAVVWFPNNPPNGEFKVGSTTANPGDYAPPFSALVINCNNRYKPSPPQRVDYPICTRGQWSIPPPTCARFCPSIKPTVATKVSCKFDNRPLDSCENPVERTIASLSCEPLYEEPGLLGNPKRICKDGGWDYPISECLPGAAQNFQANNTGYQRPTPSVEGSCLVPNNPPNGEFKVGSTTANPGDYAPQFSALVINCKKRYKPNPPQRGGQICVMGRWLPPPPTCERFCPSIKPTNTTKVSCKFDNRPLDSCENPVKGTIASFSCEPLYEEPGLLRNPKRICKGGSWDYPITECLPACGVKRPRGGVNVLNAVTGKTEDSSWHIGIYNPRKSLICGGSILDQRIVITAANCFTTGDTLANIENYTVAAGKYYSKYDDDRDEYAQYAKIDKIHIPERYMGSKNFYESDLAVLILQTKLDISEFVQPVCVDWGNNYEYQQLAEDKEGIVTGWGLTTMHGKQSDELKQLNVPYIPYEKCFDEVPKSFRKYLTPDKLCAGYKDKGTSVCNGDAGGALTFLHFDDRYYIRGIVSVAPALAGHCDSNQYATYTLVSRHIEFVRDLVNRHHGII